MKLQIKRVRGKIILKKVSIVLPVYNGEEHLAEAMDSVLTQTYKNLELIVVDDCSTDGTSQIISSFMEKDSRVKSVRNDVNQRLPKSLNIGFGLAEGELLTWTSDDNRYKSDAIEKMADYLEHHAEIGMVYCDYTIINESDAELGEKHLDEPEKLILSNVVGACFLYRVQVSEKVGDYDSEMFLAEDYDYWLRIYEAVKIAHLSENLYYYRHHSKSLTSKRLEDVKYQTVILWMKHWKFIFSKLGGIKAKCRFCDMMMNNVNDKHRRDTYKKIVKRYPLYYWYKSIGPIYRWTRTRLRH